MKEENGLGRVKQALPVVLVLAIALIATGCWSERAARTRVETMMAGWAEGGTSSSGYMQEAVSMWYAGTRFISDDVLLARARDQFDDWRRQKNLYRDIESWEIVSVEADPNPRIDAMIVGLKIDGKPYDLRVESREPIDWVQ